MLQPIQHPTEDDHIFTEYTIGPHTIETFGDVDAVWEQLCEKHGYSEVVDQNELMMELPWCKGVMKPDERHPRPPFDPHPQDLDFSAPHGLTSPDQDTIEWVENYQSKAEYPSMLFAGMTCKPPHPRPFPRVLIPVTQTMASALVVASQMGHGQLARSK